MKSTQHSAWCADRVQQALGPSCASEAWTSSRSPTDISTKPLRGTPASFRSLPSSLPPKLLLGVQNSERGNIANVHEGGEEWPQGVPGPRV